jgi:hypothetical protein
METEILELLNRLVQAAERIADAMEADVYANGDPDSEPTRDLSGRPIR